MVQEVHVWELVRDESGEIKTWRLADANPAALKSWGKNLAEVVGKTTEEIFNTPRAPELFMPIIQKIFTENKPHEWELYFRPTGQILKMISIPVGEYFISTGVDSTPERKVNKELEAANQKLAQAVSAGNIGLWSWDLETNVVEFSTEWKKQIGYEDHEICNELSEWKSRVHPDDLQNILDGVNNLLFDDSTHLEYQYRLRHKNGSYRSILTHCTVFRDDKGNPVRLVGAHTDMSGQKQVAT